MLFALKRSKFHCFPLAQWTLQHARVTTDSPSVSPSAGLTVSERTERNRGTAIAAPTTAYQKCSATKANKQITKLKMLHFIKIFVVVHTNDACVSSFHTYLLTYESDKRAHCVTVM